jgi:hypothetical protein
LKEEGPSPGPEGILTGGLSGAIGGFVIGAVVGAFTGGEEIYPFSVMTCPTKVMVPRQVMEKEK